MAISRGRIAAIKLMEDIGIQHPQELPMELIVAGRGAILIEEPMTKADGRIVHGKKHSIIKINSNRLCCMARNPANTILYVLFIKQL